MKIVALNKKAYHDFQILEKIEAGIVLTGKEARAVRQGRVQLKGSFARILKDELWLLNAHISSDNPERDRKLLVKKSELKTLIGKTIQKGLSLIPLRVYFKNNVAKIEIGLCKGLKKWDKRERIKRRDLERQMLNAK